VVLVESNGEIEGQNPRRACGSIMKKSYTPPVFRYLDFLRFPEPAFIHRDSFDPAAGAVRQDNLRNNLAYQRFYVDHSRIRR